MKKEYIKPEINIVVLKARDHAVTNISALGEDGMSVSLDWLLGK